MFNLMSAYMFYRFVFLALFFGSCLAAEEQILFTPPDGWNFADHKLLSPKVKMMVIGPARSHYPPSINLGYETYEGTMESYMATIKKINQTLKAEFRDLGTVETAGGRGRLCQIDTMTEWGEVRMQHVLLAHGKTMIVLTAAALKSEYASYYAEVFASLKSLRIENIEKTVECFFSNSYQRI